MPRAHQSPHTQAWKPDELRLPCELPRRAPTNSTSVIDYGDDDFEGGTSEERTSRVIVIDIA